jgi:ATP-dependent Lhr-like helicase
VKYAAASDVVIALRQLRNHPLEEDWTVLSAADPLNTVGILDPAQERVPATASNSFILAGGVCLARHVAGQTTFMTDRPAEEQSEMARAMVRGRRTVQAV